MRKHLAGIAVAGCALLFAAFAHAAPEGKAGQTTPTEILQQAQSGPLTIRLRRARWAESEEVLLWRNRGKQLTLWFDALLDPAVSLPEGLTPADYIVNVRLLDERGNAVEVLPIDPVLSLHRPSLPYVPAKKDWQADGQSVWRAMPFNPNFDAVKLQIEWLHPGHPFDRKTIPPSLLKAKDEAVSNEARQWLQVLEMPLPARQIEYGATQNLVAVAQARSERLDATLYKWRSGTAKVVSGEGAGASHLYFEAGLLLRAKDSRDPVLRAPLHITLQNEAGETFSMGQMQNDALRWFGPDGKILKPNERVVSGSFPKLPTTDKTTQWSLAVSVGEDARPILEMRDLPSPIGPQSPPQ